MKKPLLKWRVMVSDAACDEDAVYLKAANAEIARRAAKLLNERAMKAYLTQRRLGAQVCLPPLYYACPADAGDLAGLGFFTGCLGERENDDRRQVRKARRENL